MPDINALTKMKVLRAIRDHMDNRLAGKLKPKKVTVESVSVEPKDPNAAVDPAISHDTVMRPDTHMAMQSGAPEMPEDDEKRLMDLYSKLK